jgi:phasin
VVAAAKDQAHTGPGQTKQGEGSMNEFADKTTKAVRENLERGASATEHATRGAEQSYSLALAGMRELNIKLIEMAHANAEAVFELAHEIATADQPSDLAAIWSEHARQQFERMTRQSKELTDLGQKLAGRTTEPLARTVNKVFRYGT